MAIKNLLLDIDKIGEVIMSYPNSTPSLKVNSDKHHVYTINVANQAPALLNLYFTNGYTTVEETQGKNKELSKLVADFIIERCKIHEYASKDISLKDVSDDDFQLLIDYLKENQIRFEDGDNVAHGVKYKLIGRYRDYLFLTRYNNKRILIQGNAPFVKNILIEGLCNFLNLQKVVDIQLESINVPIKNENIQTELNQILAGSYTFLGDKIIAIISPSIVLSKLEMELTDYSVFVFPVFRGIEGYLKKLFLSKGIEVSHDGFSDYLEIDGNSNGKHRVKNNVRDDINCIKTVHAIEEVYHFYKSNRHQIFHVDGNIETTRIIKDKNIAVKSISDSLSMIESTYTKITS